MHRVVADGRMGVFGGQGELGARHGVIGRVWSSFLHVDLGSWGLREPGEESLLVMVSLALNCVDSLTSSWTLVGISIEVAIGSSKY